MYVFLLGGLFFYFGEFYARPDSPPVADNFFSQQDSMMLLKLFGIQSHRSRGFFNSKYHEVGKTSSLRT